MTTQPEALRLADFLADRNRLDLTCDAAAAELRRLAFACREYERQYRANSDELAEALDRIAALEKALEKAAEALDADDSKLWPSEKRAAALATARQTLGGAA